MSLKHVITVKEISDKKLLNTLMERAEQLQVMSVHDYPKPLKDLTVCTIFFEPSTRTRLSFETAIQNLGGHLITVENGVDSSSDKKGESLEDTIKTINCYADGVIMRHPEVGSAQRAAAVSNVPFINAGDGAGEHPTQALLDLYTIKQSKGKIDGLKIGIAGDLLYSRTMHSLTQLLAMYDVELFLISPKSLALPKEFKKILNDSGVKFSEHNSWDKILDSVDVLYTNRVQKERFKLIEDYIEVKNSFILTLPLVKTMKKDAVIMNPLPRINEIDVAVDNDPRAIYFQEVRNGLYARMALLEHIFAN